MTVPLRPTTRVREHVTGAPHSWPHFLQVPFHRCHLSLQVPQPLFLQPQTASPPGPGQSQCPRGFWVQWEQRTRQKTLSAMSMNKPTGQASSRFRLPAQGASYFLLLIASRWGLTEPGVPRRSPARSWHCPGMKLARLAPRMASRRPHREAVSSVWFLFCKLSSKRLQVGAGCREEERHPILA